jgi:dihydrofolate synthase/folylpolyglutamate synthase
MDYNQTLDYLYTQLPVFTRVGASAYKADLDNTIALLKILGNPEHKFKSVHVGGTNGKGSTSHMLAAILQVAGYKTGLYTSPHLKDFRERIRINGEMISEQTVVDFVAKHRPDFEQIQPSFFEMTVALAFDAFAKEQVDIAIVEVGLGGRLDSTNVINPLLSIITNIGWDHMNLLGDTLQKIAGEKAGIIKPATPVIIGEYQPEVAEVFTNKAKHENAPLTFASKAWHIETIKGKMRQEEYSEILEVETTYISTGATHIIKLDLNGTYQTKNLKTVLSAVAELREQGFNITDTNIATALKQVKTLTGLHGRWGRGYLIGFGVIGFLGYRGFFGAHIVVAHTFVNGAIIHQDTTGTFLMRRRILENDKIAQGHYHTQYDTGSGKCFRIIIVFPVVHFYF